MATLTSADVKDILVARPGKKRIEAGEAMHKKLCVHLHGVGLADYLEQVKTYEKPEALALRKQYARSNKALFDRLIRPVDKVFSARGGGRYFDLATDGIKDSLEQDLLDVEWGFSTKRWVEKFWKPRYMDDPMGLIFMEVGQDEVYPTYKSIADIFDYKLEGRRVQWLVLRTPDKQVYRVIDDRFDMLYKIDGESVRKVGPTYPNYLGFVPAIVISDIPRDAKENTFDSPLDSVVELADEYLRDTSIRNIYKFKHGFPKSWKYRETCGDCKGTGAIGGNICRTCNGTGKKLDSTVAEVMVLDWPTGTDPVIAPDVAGYITPDLEYLKSSQEELSALEQLMFFTHWGTHRADTSKSGNPETATARFIDVQPVNERLIGYSDAAASVDKFITDAIGMFNYPGIYRGCSLTYGHRFLVEGPDVLWKKYEMARKMGAPQATLDEHLKDYYEAKFQTNVVELKKYLKMMQVEPFVHLTIEQAQAAVGPDEFGRKLFFSEWANTLTEAEWITTPVKTLKEQLTAFAKARYEPPIDPKAAAQEQQAKGEAQAAGGVTKVEVT